MDKSESSHRRTHLVTISRAFFFGVAFFPLLIAPSYALEGKGRATPLEPCCNITAIDARSGIATAKDAKTGRTFQFKAATEGLKVGQTIHANFTTMQVSVRPDGAVPC